MASTMLVPIVGTMADITLAAILVAFAVVVLCSAGMMYLGAKTKQVQWDLEQEDAEEEEADERAGFDKLKLWLLTPEGRAFAENVNGPSSGPRPKRLDDDESEDDGEEPEFDFSSLESDLPATEDGVPSATMAMFDEFGTPGTTTAGGAS